MTKRRKSPAGRKSLYADSDRIRDSPMFYMDLTPQGREALAILTARTGLTRNSILAVLAVEHADQLTFPSTESPFPGKLARDVLSIRLPTIARKKLQGARSRTGHSYSDLGEALILWYGLRRKHWPSLPEPAWPTQKAPPAARPTRAYHVVGPRVTRTFLEMDTAAAALAATPDGLLLTSVLTPRKADRLRAWLTH